MSDWLTNSPEAAKQLRAIDKAYERERAKCADWPLKLKVSRFRRLKQDKEEAYDRVLKRFAS